MYRSPHDRQPPLGRHCEERSSLLVNGTVPQNTDCFATGPPVRSSTFRFNTRFFSRVVAEKAFLVGHKTNKGGKTIKGSKWLVRLQNLSFCSKICLLMQIRHTSKSRANSTLVYGWCMDEAWIVHRECMKRFQTTPPAPYLAASTANGMRCAACLRISEETPFFPSTRTRNRSDST